MLIQRGEQAHSRRHLRPTSVRLSRAYHAIDQGYQLRRRRRMWPAGLRAMYTSLLRLRASRVARHLGHTPFAPASNLSETCHIISSTSQQASSIIQASRSAKRPHKEQKNGVAGMLQRRSSRQSGRWLVQLASPADKLHRLSTSAYCTFRVASGGVWDVRITSCLGHDWRVPWTNVTGISFVFRISVYLLWSGAKKRLPPIQQASQFARLRMFQTFQACLVCRPVRGAGVEGCS